MPSKTRHTREAALLAAAKSKGADTAFAGARIALALTPDIDAVDDRGATALYCAIEKGNVKLVDWLIGKGADVDKAIPLDRKKGWKKGDIAVEDSPLHCAIRHADADKDNYGDFVTIVEKLLKAGANRNVTRNSITPIEYAEHYHGFRTPIHQALEPEYMKIAREAALEEVSGGKHGGRAEKRYLDLLKQQKQAESRKQQLHR